MGVSVEMIIYMKSNGLTASPCHAP